MGLDNLAPIEERVDEKVIFASCKKNFLTYFYGRQISCNVPGAAPGDNVVVTKNSGENWGCNFITSAQVLKHNVVSIMFYDGYVIPAEGGPAPFCSTVHMKGFVTFSIIVFRPEITSQGVVD